MRNHCFLVLVLILVVGVFGVDTDGVKSVSVMEGDSVTLLTDLTEIQTDEVLKWKFQEDTIIAEIDGEDMSVPGNDEGSFKGRLMLDKTTGSLTITNIKTTDNGDYKLQFRNQSWSGNKKVFRVTVHEGFGVDTDGVKSVSVMEGDSVTLHTDLTKIQTDEVLQWKTEHDTIIAEIDGEHKAISLPGNEESFKGRLKLDPKTGSLTILNIKTTDSGVYKLKISGKKLAESEFSVTVRGVFSDDGVKKMSERKGESVNLQTEIISIPDDDVIVWTFGPQDTALVRTDQQNNIIIYNKDDVRFKDRLYLNTKSGDLTVKNISTEDSGQYKVRIIKRTYTLLKIFSVTLSGVFGVDTDGVKIEVSVMEGDSVTLHTDLTEIQTGGKLKWRFPDDTIIAQIDRETSKISVPGNIRFKSRLKLDETTGSLTITNIKTTDPGVYKLNISNTNGVTFKEFSVSVHGEFSDDGVKKMSERKGESVTLQTEIISIPDDDVIEWTFGPQDTALVRTDRQNNIIIYNKGDVRFKDRLYLNTKSGDLTVKNISTEVSGRYKVRIIKRTYTLQKIFSVTVDDSHEPSGYTAIIVSVIFGAIALVACAVAVFYWKKHKQSSQTYADAFRRTDSMPLKKIDSQ